MITKDQIKQSAIARGFKLSNETGDDLKPYVYEFARDIIALTEVAPEAEPDAVPVGLLTLGAIEAGEYTDCDIEIHHKAAEALQEKLIINEGGSLYLPVYAHPPRQIDAETRRDVLELCRLVKINQWVVPDNMIERAEKISEKLGATDEN